jgi:hypothetical protein
MARLRRLAHGGIQHDADLHDHYPVHAHDYQQVGHILYM